MVHPTDFQSVAGGPRHEPEVTVRPAILRRRKPGVIGALVTIFGLIFFLGLCIGLAIAGIMAPIKILSLLLG